MNTTSIDPTNQWVETPPEIPLGEDEALAGVAQAMPWVLSLLFHVGLFLIMIFVVFISRGIAEERPRVIPDAVQASKDHHRMTVENPHRSDKAKTPINAPRIMPDRESVSVGAGKTPNALDVSGLGNNSGGGGGGGDGTGIWGPPSTYRPPTFYRTKTGKSVVYVIDRSGSMMDTFDSVRMEMIRSIVRLNKQQKFHVIFFNSGSHPQEPLPKQLVPATRGAKKHCVNFLGKISPESSTDPLPALKRAFAVLRREKKKDKVIFLLTDGVFPDNQAVLDLVGRENADQSVRVNTILYGTRPPEAEEVLKTIASRNHGNYTFQEHSE